MSTTELIKLDVCERILDHVLTESQANGQFCINMYDIRLKDTTADGGCGMNFWPPGLSNLRKYLSVKTKTNRGGGSR